MAREVKEVRKQFSSPLAMQYTGIARGLLGTMKSQMQKSGITQLSWTKTFKRDVSKGKQERLEFSDRTELYTQIFMDTVEITVDSINGQDSIEISIPEAVLKSTFPKEKREDSIFRILFNTLYKTDSPTLTARSAIWTPGKVEVLDDLYLPGDISFDGGTVLGIDNPVGSAPHEAVRKAGVIQILHDVTGGTRRAGGRLSYNGRKATFSLFQASAPYNSGWHIFYWAAETGGDVVASGPTDQWFRAISLDGTTCVGALTASGVQRATKWTLATGVNYLGAAPETIESEAKACSKDGSIVVGWHSVPRGAEIARHACYWDASGLLYDIGAVEGHTDSEANDVSADGTVIVGQSKVDPLLTSVSYPFKWTSTTGAVQLPTRGSPSTLMANRITPDGKIVIGSGDDSVDYACYWDVRNEAHFLIDESDRDDIYFSNPMAVTNAEFDANHNVILP